MVEDPLLRVLRDEVRAHGWYHPPSGRMAVELASHLALALGGIAAFLAAPSLLVGAARWR